MAIESYDDIIAGRASGGADDVYYAKTTAVGGVTTTWYSYAFVGGAPAAMSPATLVSNGSIMNNLSTGAIPLRSASPYTNDKALLTFGAQVSNANMATLMLVDVLWAAASVNMAVAYQQNTTQPALTRYTDGIGNRICLVVTTALGSSAITVTVNFTDENDAAKSVTGTTVASAAANRIAITSTTTCFFDLPAGVKGVKAITSVQLSSTTGSTSWACIMLVHPLLMMPSIAVTTYVERDSTVQIDGLCDLGVSESDGTCACLALMGYTTGTSTSTVQGIIRTVEK